MGGYDPSKATILYMAGPVFIGCMLNWFLFGCLVIQMYDYHTQHFVGDRAPIKILVYGIFIVELASTFLITNTSWTYLVLEAEKEIRCPITSAPAVGVNITITCIVQTFFAWRIYRLRQDLFGKLAAALVVFVALLSFASGLAFAHQYVTFQQARKALGGLKPVTSVWLAGTFTCDLIIAVAMLLHAKSTSTFSDTRSLLNKLVVHTIETGAITAVVVAVELILFLLYPYNFLHLAPMYVLGRLYSNVLFTALNGRNRMRDMFDSTHASRCIDSLQLRTMTHSNGTHGEAISIELRDGAGRSSVENSGTTTPTISSKRCDCESSGIRFRTAGHSDGVDLDPIAFAGEGPITNTTKSVRGSVEVREMNLRRLSIAVQDAETLPP